MAHRVKPILPFNITLATFLVPNIATALSTADLLAIHACQLQKCEADLTAIYNNILCSCFQSVTQFMHTFEKSIKDFDFKPGTLVLVCNSSIETDLGHKSKPCYTGPMITVWHTPNGSYWLTELDGTVAKLRFAAFHLIPYYAHSCSSIPITRIINHKDLLQIHLDEDQNNTTANPGDSGNDDKPHTHTIQIFSSSLPRDSQDFNPLAGVRSLLDLGSEHSRSVTSEHSELLSDQFRLAALKRSSAKSHIGFLPFFSTLLLPQLPHTHHPCHLLTFPLQDSAITNITTTPNT
ncbi:hypothetical protein BJV74DRAFT_768440 [Russula compacta]|nr:hypothetical protein BJV74DRAFT_768440 [Russula compacta]